MTQTREPSRNVELKYFHLYSLALDFGTSHRNGLPLKTLSMFYAFIVLLCNFHPSISFNLVKCDVNVSASERIKNLVQTRQARENVQEIKVEWHFFGPRSRPISRAVMESVRVAIPHTNTHMPTSVPTAVCYLIWIFSPWIFFVSVPTFGCRLFVELWETGCQPNKNIDAAQQNWFEFRNEWKAATNETLQSEFSALSYTH